MDSRPRRSVAGAKNLSSRAKKTQKQVVFLLFPNSRNETVGFFRRSKESHSRASQGPAAPEPKMQISLASEAKIVEKTIVFRDLEPKILEKTTVFLVLELKIFEKTNDFRDLERQRVSRESPSRPGASNIREN